MESIATLLNTYQSVIREVEECSKEISAKETEVRELEDANREYDEELRATESNIARYAEMNAMKMKELLLLREERSRADELKSQLLKDILEVTPTVERGLNPSTDCKEDQNEVLSIEELGAKLIEMRDTWKARLEAHAAVQQREEQQIKQKIEEEEQSLALIVACADGIDRQISAIKQQLDLVPAARRMLELPESGLQPSLYTQAPISMHQTITSTEEVYERVDVTTTTYATNVELPQHNQPWFSMKRRRAERNDSSFKSAAKLLEEANLKHNGNGDREEF